MAERRRFVRSSEENQPITMESHNFHVVELSPSALLVKRIFDIVFSLAGLLMLSPLFLVIAVIIKLTSKGPVFYSQKRVGKGGRVFNFYKFRSMVVNADKIKESLKNVNEATGPVFKMKHDPRVTKIGRFIRKYSIDELPQLFNVLKNDMSLVGPRPPIPDEVKKYKGWQTKRLAIQPGITCIWQTSGRSRIGFEDWVRMDIYYIENWSLWLDIKLLFKTVKTVVTADGAY
ncbi:MAG: sugar transferase [Oligoflexales bacterium]|nr:sugar transferase [Oligoflexales bacterium]